MDINIFTKRGYTLSSIEQKAAVLLAHGFRVESVAAKLSIDLSEAEQVCRAARIKMTQSFGKDAFAHLRLIDIGSVLCAFLCVFVLFQDIDTARAARVRLPRRGPNKELMEC